MHFIDIFIRRPVLATVISLLILTAGLGGIFSLQVRQYPEMNDATIIINTPMPGANPGTVQGFVTDPLERSVGSVNGVDYMQSSSKLGVSSITVKVGLDANPYNVLSEVVQKVNAVKSQLPREAESSSINMQTGDSFPVISFSVTSDDYTVGQMTAYAKNVLQPKITALGGISEVQVLGGQEYAMRVFLDFKKMAQLGITYQQVSQALASQSLLSTGGKLRAPFQNIVLNPATDLGDADAYKKLVVANDDGNLIRLSDIATVKLGAESYDSSVRIDGHEGVFVGVLPANDANVLDVINRIQDELPSIKHDLPPGMKLNTIYNQGDSIQESIDEVIRTIIEAGIIVSAVLFCFVGALRMVLIPVVTVPLSLLGAFFLMMLMGFSINLLTLLAMVLAIGLVVDDAILVMENVYRYIELGFSPFKAAIQGAREIANPVVLTTMTLISIFLPIGMMSGFTGVLFTEFAYSLAAAVLISGIIAYTSSPVLSSRVLSQKIPNAPLVKLVDKTFARFKNFYTRMLIKILAIRHAMILFILVILASCYYMYTGTQNGLAPQEDMSIVAFQGQGPSSANINYLSAFDKPIENILQDQPAYKTSFVVNGWPSSNNVFGGIVMKNFNDRKKNVSQQMVYNQLSTQMSNISGLQVTPFQLPPLPGMDPGPNMQFVIQSLSSYEKINHVSEKVIQDMENSGLFLVAFSNLNFDSPQLNINIKRDKAADLGISMKQIAETLQVAYSSGQINYFNMLGHNYKVIPQLQDDQRLTREQLGQLQIKAASGEMVPLNSIISFDQTTKPLALNRFQQFNSATISAVTAPGVSQGQAYQFMQKLAKNDLPTGYSHSYLGSIRQFIEQGSTMMVAFMFAIIVIFLLLSAQFESFRDGIIILISVPMSICGALIPLYLGQLFGLPWASINIYTQLGLVTLIGLITKHGILMVEFANKFQDEGMDKYNAIITAASIRLRPILMTTLAMVAGVVPLMYATGSGAHSRNAIGWTIGSGMTIGTIFTLFVVPVVYMFLSLDRQSLLNRWADEDRQIEELNQQKRSEVLNQS